jgi:hypothetical protein
MSDPKVQATEKPKADGLYKLYSDAVGKKLNDAVEDQRYNQVRQYSEKKRMIQKSEFVPQSKEVLNQVDESKLNEGIKGLKNALNNSTLGEQKGFEANFGLMIRIHNKDGTTKDLHAVDIINQLKDQIVKKQAKQIEIDGMKISHEMSMKLRDEARLRLAPYTKAFLRSFELVDHVFMKSLGAKESNLVDEYLNELKDETKSKEYLAADKETLKRTSILTNDARRELLGAISVLSDSPIMPSTNPAGNIIAVRSAAAGMYPTTVASFTGGKKKSSKGKKRSSKKAKRMSGGKKKSSKKHSSKKAKRMTGGKKRSSKGKKSSSKKH